ncbi:envelope stress response membrane protein PspB [Pleionea mediterranea]|jgi:phage shock protein B|uniref:Phage shock protein B n=1 Tax=Pleionea mediterranea TaxID=523701 RepID=A0A316G270_9GAMM|nr:envelope stress response membrane protein PspB [Pleionea mediterranea]PWK54495.1 phage shock protein B [Pleionea mediterranea]
MDDVFLFVLGIIVAVCVVPYWLKLHYGDKNNANKKNKKNNSNQDIEELNELSDLADSLNKRVLNLESILDNESPDWRKKYE